LRNIIEKYLLLLFILVLNSTQPHSCLAQVFSFDYLTYYDSEFIPEKFNSYNLATYLFFGTGEFASFGESEQNIISYREYHVHFAYALNFEEKFQITVAPQLGGLFANGISSTSYGDVWILGKYRFSNTIPIAFRLGFKLGKIGKSFWLKQNDFDIGILASKSFLCLKIGGAISYRIRGKSEFDLLDFAGRFNQPGNAISYKFELYNQFTKELGLSVFFLGQASEDKKIDGTLLANSNSRKTTVGASMKIRNTDEYSYKLGILVDVAGKHDKKGFAIGFTLMH